MNKITDFKSNKNFNNGGPKFSLCLETDGLTCQIPNVYKTFCDGAVDPTKNAQLNLDINHIKSYLIGTLVNPDPFDVIVNKYETIGSSQFKTDFDPCQNFIVSDNRTQEGFDIILKTIDFMKQVCQLTGYDERDFSYFKFMLFLDPRSLNIKTMTDICLLSQDIKEKLRISCIIYIISNSKKILKSNGNLLNSSLYEAMIYFSRLLEDIVTFLVNKLSVPTDLLIREKLNIYDRYPILFYLFFTGLDSDSDTFEQRDKPNLLYNFQRNKILGEESNNNDPEAFVTGFFFPNETFGLPLKWFTTCPKELLATSICHEIGHTLKELNPQPVSIQNYLILVNDIASKWDRLNFQYLDNSGKIQIAKFNGIYQELFCDIFGVEWLENYLFNTPEGNALSDDQKYNVIKQSYTWNCEYPNSSIQMVHPHHSLRVNLLLLSKRIHNFLCSYSNPNLVKFNANSNPACLNDADYSTHSEYYSKYLKYKNKYLALKKQSNN
jgi:hypothetical protein